MVEAMQGYVDLFLVETMSCAEEATQAIEAIGSGAPGTPTMISYTLSPSGEFRNGESPTDGLKRTIDYCHERKVKGMPVLCIMHPLVNQSHHPIHLSREHFI
jgi:S-methylmethionine-dependent homocysteine/selenocysteine methylase